MNTNIDSRPHKEDDFQKFFGGARGISGEGIREKHDVVSLLY